MDVMKYAHLGSRSAPRLQRFNELLAPEGTHSIGKTHGILQQGRVVSHVECMSACIMWGPAHRLGRYRNELNLRRLAPMPCCLLQPL